MSQAQLKLTGRRGRDSLQRRRGRGLQRGLGAEEQQDQRLTGSEAGREPYLLGGKGKEWF